MEHNKLFKNREEAGKLLAKKLYEIYAHKSVAIFAIPRGAIHMARIIAEKLDGDLDVVLVHKIGAPDNPEFAIGSVDEKGNIVLDKSATALMFSDEYIRRCADHELEKIRERRKAYSSGTTDNLSDKIAIIVDDGIATGNTMFAAIRSIRERNAEKIIAASAVAPVNTIMLLREKADEVVVLASPEPFIAVGNFFDDFSQVSDKEVIQALTEFREVRKKSIIK